MLMMQLHKPLRQAGDTIVEVIVVLAVLGLAISISYATANRSLQATRQAEENAQATQILQGQIEALRSYATNTSTDPNYIFRSPQTFCVATTGNIAEAPAACLNGIFAIAISYDSANSDTFTARATWDDVTGSGKDTVVMVYRVHPAL